MNAVKGAPPKVLAYYFPSWHEDPRNASWFGQGWSEWKLVHNAQPRFPSHRQPRRPLQQFDDRSPSDFETQIGLARKYGVDGFIFDYYWYDDGPYLNGALDDGYLHAKTREDIEFGIMWANHNLVDIFPANRDTPALLKNGAVDAPTFAALTQHIIDHYFSQKSYLRLAGRPWFSIYELGALIDGLGGIAETKAALQDFDERVRAAGHPGVHLDAVLWGFSVLPSAHELLNPDELIAQLGFSSASSYVWIHHIDAAQSAFPTGSWDTVREEAFADYDRLARALQVPVYPNVTVGWDSSPRTAKAHPFTHGTYPWFPVWDATPMQFAQGLSAAHRFVEKWFPEGGGIVTINAWNEWTEGSYLLPDATYGTEFLEAIEEQFPSRPSRA